MENLSFFEKLNFWAKRSVTLKILTIGILILILLIPSNWIKNLIQEREYRQREAINEVSSKWGEIQTITGPVISIPYKKFYKDEYNRVQESIGYAHFLPDELLVDGKIIPEKRHRGIYDVALYKSDLNIEGNFDKIDFESWDIPKENILWKDAFIYVGIPDMRGIKDKVVLNLNGKEYYFDPGIRSSDICSSGISVKIPISPNNDSINYNFEFDLKLNGSEKLEFVPIGKETIVNLSGVWGDPSFDGQFLPTDRSITDSTFEAHWKVLHLNRNYPQKWINNEFDVSYSEFSVTLFQPVDTYQKSMRTAKYNVMFIFLTFLVFFFIEIIKKERIHPIIYLLVGFAVSIFYVLLLSISEHLSFNLSYLIASIAVLALVGLYSKAIFKSFKMSIVLAMLLALLYIFFFTLLQLQEYALLLGSIGLFIILAVVMYLSRNINWYINSTKPDAEINDTTN